MDIVETWGDLYYQKSGTRGECSKLAATRLAPRHGTLMVTDLCPLPRIFYCFPRTLIQISIYWQKEQSHPVPVRWWQSPLVVRIFMNVMMSTSTLISDVHVTVWGTDAADHPIHPFFRSFGTLSIQLDRLVGHFSVVRCSTARLCDSLSPDSIGLEVGSSNSNEFRIETRGRGRAVDRQYGDVFSLGWVCEAFLLCIANHVGNEYSGD